MKNYLLPILALFFAGITVQAETLACAAPTGVQIQRMSNSTATIWADDNSATYDLYIKPTGDPAPTATTAPRPGFNDLAFPFTSNRLQPQFGYDLYVRTQCNGETSAWTGPFLIEVYETCDVPTGVWFDRTSDTEATFYADDTSALYDTYVVLDGEAGPANDFFTDPNTPNGNNDIMSGFSRSDLSPAFGYDVYVRKQCNNSQVSEWVGPFDIDPFVAECPAPSNVEITRTSHTTATFDGADPAYTYQGTANRAGRPLRPRPLYGMENMTLPHTQGGLIEAFDYDVWLRTDCGDGMYSDWTGPFYLPLYEEACVDAMNVTINRTGANSGTISADNTDQMYDLFIVLSGNNGPAANAEPNIHGEDGITFPLTRNDLAASIDYDIYVRTQCEDGSHLAWTGPYYVPAWTSNANRITPNPTSGLVKFDGFNAVSAQVVNLTGKTELNTKVTNNEMNISQLAPGQYIIQAVDAKGNVQSFQVIKK